MLYLDQTFACPSENLALDQLLLVSCEETGTEYLRVWQPSSTFVVIGRGNVAEEHVDLNACSRDSVAVLRRESGGGAVVLGVGCLCYSLIVQLKRDSALLSSTGANRYLLEKIRDALGGNVAIAGDSDLVIGDLKIAGHAQRRLRRSVLLHGSLLMGMKLESFDAYLKHPPRMPAYRCERLHSDFVRNHAIDPKSFVDSLRRAFGANEIASGDFGKEVQRIATERWSDPHWRIG